jgi:hypothetical protein
MNPVESPATHAPRIFRYRCGALSAGHALLRESQGQTRILVTGRPLPLAAVLCAEAPDAAWSGRVAACRPGRVAGEFVVVVVASAPRSEAV